MISVCINTKNRANQLIQCLRSILRNDFSDFEIIVVDQSNQENTVQITRFINSIYQIKYFFNTKKGVSSSKNLALDKTLGEIISFTDDDCLVDKEWLKNIYKTFQKKKEIVGVFGKVLPYKPQLHKGQICPCIYFKKKENIISKPCFHGQDIGFGNNMAFKRQVFNEVGGFKEWLGIESIGKAAEDAEFALRLLTKNYKLLYSPKIKVYHNRWLTKDEFRRQSLSYSCGEIACYGYFAFQGKKFGQEVIAESFLKSQTKLINSFQLILSIRKTGFTSLYFSLIEFIFKLWGLIIAWFYSKREPL